VFTGNMQPLVTSLYSSRFSSSLTYYRNCKHESVFVPLCVGVCERVYICLYLYIYPCLCECVCVTPKYFNDFPHKHTIDHVNSLKGGSEFVFGAYRWYLRIHCGLGNVNTAGRTAHSRVQRKKYKVIKIINEIRKFGWFWTNCFICLVVDISC
jgi:hypothetical protein